MAVDLAEIEVGDVVDVTGCEGKRGLAWMVCASLMIGGEGSKPRDAGGGAWGCMRKGKRNRERGSVGASNVTFTASGARSRTLSPFFFFFKQKTAYEMIW